MFFCLGIVIGCIMGMLINQSLIDRKQKTTWISCKCDLPKENTCVMIKRWDDKEYEAIRQLHMWIYPSALSDRVSPDDYWRYI